MPAEVNYLTTRQIAERLRTSPDRIVDLIHAGHFLGVDIRSPVARRHMADKSAGTGRVSGAMRVAVATAPATATPQTDVRALLLSPVIVLYPP